MTIKPIPRLLRPFFRFHHGHDNKWAWRIRPDIWLLFFLYRCGFIRAGEGERLQWARFTFDIGKVHDERYRETFDYAYDIGHKKGVIAGRSEILDAQLAELRRRAVARAET